MSTAPKYACGVCGKQQTAEKMIFSAHSRQRYCADLKACRERKRLSERRQRVAERSVT